MNQRYSNLIPALALLLLLLGSAPAQAQAEAGPVRIEAVRLGPHPTDTRLLIDLSGPVKYEAKADFQNKKITLTFPGAVLGDAIRSRSYRDKNLASLTVEPGPGLTLGLVSANTRFFHSIDPKTGQLVIDLKQPPPAGQTAEPGARVPPAKQAASAKPAVAEAKPAAAPRKPARAERRNTRIAGLGDRELARLNKKDDDEKTKHGHAERIAALRLLQGHNYAKAIEKFEAFNKKFPESKYRGEILYLIAESHYQAAREEENPVYDSALDAYKYALRQSPGSPFARHAQYKIAQIYNEIGYSIEAKALYEDVLKKSAGDPYNQARQIDLASMLLDKGKYQEAYEAYQGVLKNAPKNIAAREALFTIAKHHYDEREFPRAIQIYEEGARRWPSQLNERPEIHFYMGDIYFSQQNYAEAKRSLYQLVNLAPGDPRAHRALNLIGDAYLLEKQELKALSVFDESARRNAESPEGRYALIRMADIGVRSPNLPVGDFLVDASAYREPFKTYQTVSKQASDVDTLAEITLSRGNSYLEEQSYLKALEEFKKLLPLGKTSEHYPRARARIIETLNLLVDEYSNQGGALPILYSYSDFLGLSLGELNNAKTLLQVGEAYQAIGLYGEALNFYERIKVMDREGVFSDRIVLNLGAIHLERKDYKEAEAVARAFLKAYPKSPRAGEAMKVLGKSYWGQKKLRDALKVFQDVTRRPSDDASEAHYLLAEAHNALGQRDDAVREYQRAIDAFDPDARSIPWYVRSAYYTLGKTHHRAGHYPQAVKALDQARKLFPEHPQKTWADYLIADSYEKMRNTRSLTRELKQLADTEGEDNLLRQAAENKLKVLDWEKNIKTRL